MEGAALRYAGVATLSDRGRDMALEKFEICQVLLVPSIT